MTADKWTLAACRERAKGDTYETASEHIAKAFVDRAQLLALVERMTAVMRDAAPDLRKAVHAHAAEMFRLVGASSDNCVRCERLAVIAVRMEALLREIDGGDPR